MVGVEPALRVELPSTLRFQLPQLLLKLCNLGGSHLQTRSRNIGQLPGDVHQFNFNLVHESVRSDNATRLDLRSRAA